MYSLTNELAYLIGTYLSDGWVGIYTKNGQGNYEFQLQVTDKDFIDEVTRCIEVITNRKPSIWREKQPREGFKQMWSVVVYDKRFVTYLIESTEKKSKIPEDLFLADKEIKKAFLAGFLDGDGWVQVAKRGGQIQIGMVSTSEWIDDIARIAQSIGVKIGKRQVSQPTKTYLVTGKKLVISYLLQTKSFIQSGCYFKIQRKQNRLRDYNFAPYKHTEEIKEKIRQSKLGDKNSSKRFEVRLKIGLTQRLKNIGL